MPKKRTVCPYYTKRMSRLAHSARALPLLQQLAVAQAIKEALAFRRFTASFDIETYA